MGLEHTYDVYDRRIGKTLDSDGAGTRPATTERYIYDGDNIALVFSGNTLKQRYLYGPGVDQVLAEDTGTTVRWALVDHQGTIRDVTDANGAVINHLRYDSFGKVISQTRPTAFFRFGYTGRETDTESGLMYYRARYYDPGVGRFISEDTIGFDGGDTNLYRYVGNSPLNFTDPSGNSAIGNFVNAVLASDITYTLVDKADEYWAGFANVVTGGLSNQIREAIYGSSVRCNQQGFFYNLGQAGGVVNTIALGFVSPTQLGAGLSFAQKFALGYEVTNTGVGAYNSTRNILEGKATSWDTLSFLPLANYGGQNLSSLSGLNIQIFDPSRILPPAFIPNPGGRLGNSQTRTKIQEVINDLQARGFTDIDTEVLFRPGSLGSGRKRFADVIGVNPQTGQSEIIQVGRTIRRDPKVLK